MLDKALKIMFGSKHERDIRNLMPLIENINAMETEMKQLSNEELGAQTHLFKKRLEDGDTLDDILPAAFAVVREAAWRTLGLRHYDVQMIGGIVLHQGNIAEMKTGEGKTLVSTLPVYLNALSGKGVHVVTVNDYLAGRDAGWMKPVYDLLNISVGVIQNNMDFGRRKEAYNSDITYGTNNEFGFDYLRDNMVDHADFRVQRGHAFAIVDEVDSILIDEARTPLIISGATEDNTAKYGVVDKAVRGLIDAEEKGPGTRERDEEEASKTEEHIIIGFYYDIDEKSKNVIMTEEGVHKMEELLGVENLYAADNVDLVTHTTQALRAHLIYRDEVDYVVRGNEVIIVDEHTGRLMEGRRYSDGLHQAIEAKERVEIKKETQTLASITFQNFFRMYDKLAGMTGTADTEAEEFRKIYGLNVVVIPTNVPVARKDHADRIYRTENEKFNAIINEIRERNENKQPILIGTVSIEKSELLASLLKKEGISHNVLNAKQHDREAEIVQNAGKPGAITVATNMAGRGTDIVLGGYPLYTKDLEDMEETDDSVREFKELLLKKKYEDARQAVSRINGTSPRTRAKEIIDMADIWLENHNFVKDVGGLHIIGTERHESRRIDNQLRGRSGRQGDPGSSRFYLSLEDTLMRIFGGEKIMGIMKFLGMEEGQELESRQVDKAIERAQKRVEGHNFDIRKHLIEYDDVMNTQRTFVYLERNKILDNDGVRESLMEWAKEVVENRIVMFCQNNDVTTWDMESLTEWMKSNLALKMDLDIDEFRRTKNPQLEIFNTVWDVCEKFYHSKIERYGEDNMNYVERKIAIDVIDRHWKEHLYTLDHLREGVWASSYSEKNPLVEYKIQGFQYFDEMVERIKEDIISFIFRAHIESAPMEEEILSADQARGIGQESHSSLQSFGGEGGGSLPGFQPVKLNTPRRHSSPGSDDNHDHGSGGVNVSTEGGSKRKSSRRSRSRK